MSAHAKNRPPSAAKRWLACPFSATVAAMYPNEDSAQSLKGDHWHALMEDLITFGTLPLTADATAAEELEKLKEYVFRRVAEGGPETRVYVEQRLDIPETGEFGTVDILIVAPSFLEVVDEKSGYVPVEVERNEQCLVYLLGAIAKHGPRDQYHITIHQPNFDHIDGPLRHYPVQPNDTADLRERIFASLKTPDLCVAGHHCKATYCPHRGACEAFRVYCLSDLSLGWHTSELKAMSDDDLGAALDASDELGGWRTELRTEAMKRIMNMDRQIAGYKVVKGRRSRAITKPRELVLAVRDAIGVEWASRLFLNMEWAKDDLQKHIRAGFLDEELLKSIGTPKHVEDLIKQYARQASLPNGTWRTIYDNLVGKYIRETASGLTLEKAIDGRPAHKRGSEFGVIDPATDTSLPTIL